MILNDVQSVTTKDPPTLLIAVSQLSLPVLELWEGSYMCEPWQSFKYFEYTLTELFRKGSHWNISTDIYCIRHRLNESILEDKNSHVVIPCNTLDRLQAT